MRCLRRVDAGLSQLRFVVVSGPFDMGFTGDKFFFVCFSVPLLVSFSQCFVLIQYCAYQGNRAKTGKLKQSGTVPGIRKGRGCWKRKYFVIVFGLPDG
jgi:hypothetical protein